MSARKGSFTVDSSLGFGLAVLGFLLLKARILTKYSETTLLKLFASAFYMSLKNLSAIILCHQW